MPRRGINLTEDEWRLVKSRAAANGMTVSAYIAHLVNGLQTFFGDDTPETSGARKQPTDAAPGDFSKHTTFGQPAPAPKPSRKKR